MKRTSTLLAALALLAAPCWAGSGIGAYGTWWDTDDADDDIGAGILLELGLGSRFDLELRTSWYGSLPGAGAEAPAKRTRGSRRAHTSWSAPRAACSTTWARGA